MREGNERTDITTKKQSYQGNNTYSRNILQVSANFQDTPCTRASDKADVIHGTPYPCKIIQLDNKKI